MNRVYEYMSKMFENIKYFDEIPKGKGVRAKLITSINPDAVILAAAVESIHLASLLHDDVIDDSKLRRGKISINAKYGDKTAIMLGDILFAKALENLINYDKKAGEELAKTIYILSLGEMEDVALSKSMNLDKEKYMSMIYKKTAVLIEMSCKEAARLANLDYEKYALYGRNLGLVFQIIDDILDIISDEETLGKPVMNDLYEGKMTLPFIYMYEELNKKEKEYFKTLFKKRLNQKEEKWIKDRIESAIKKSYLEAKNLAKEGIKEIKEPFLREIMMKLIERKF
jgi:octaprenyl-diphosphate synthase